MSDAKKNSEDKPSQKLVLYGNAILNRNQIGEFLKVLDNEQELKQNLDEFKVEIKEAEQDLFNMFAEIGFTPSANFNVSKADDYNLARTTLLNYRNKLLSSAISKVSSLQKNTNTVIKDRMIKINNIIAALKKDSDAYTNLSDASEDNAELDEAIKTEKANRSVTGRHENEAGSDFENQMDKVGDIYCSQLKGNI